MRRLLCCIMLFSLFCFPARGLEQPKYVALTFDDGPSGRFTRRLLEGLEQRNVKATFLLCGYRLELYPDLARKIHEAGHEIGLHSYSHADMSKLDYPQARREIRENLALLPEGCRPVFFRPPGGAAAQSTLDAARDAGFALLHWSVDPRDWATHDAAAVEAAVLETVQDGDVILLHDMCDCSVDAALAIIDRLTEQGFRFVTVSQLAMLRGIVPQPGKSYSAFR